MKKGYKRYIILLIIVAIIVLCGQLLKSYIINNYKDQGSTSFVKDMINITYVENKGGAWGIGQGDTITFVISNLLVLGIIIKFIITQKDRMRILDLSALTLILGGGASNFIDRVFRGFVLDYIDISPLFKFPVFNLEDTIIVIGWILFIFAVAISMIKLKNEKVEDRFEENNSK